MDSGSSGSENGDNGNLPPRGLPSDLPKSINDRRHVVVDYVRDTEMYDGWQGQSYYVGGGKIGCVAHCLRMR